MKESKLSYIALAISVGAAALCGVSALLSVFPNSSKIDQLTHQVETLTVQNAQLRAIAPYVGNNRSRINELDVGMTALANVLKVDRGELAKAYAAVKAAKEADDDASKATSKAQDSDAGANDRQPTQGTVDTDNQPKTAPQTLGGSKEKPEQSLPASTVKAATAASQPSYSPDKTAPPLMGADNPFAAGLDSSNAGGEVAPAISISPANTGRMTIDQVDAVLGKRLSTNWYKPAGDIDGLSAIVQLKMSRDGKVAMVRIGKSSGNKAFDTSALSAVQSIGVIEEVRQLSDADFQTAYASRSIQFTPKMGQ